MAIKLHVKFSGVAKVEAVNYDSPADAEQKLTKAIHDALAAQGSNIYVGVDVELAQS